MHPDIDTNSKEVIKNRMLKHALTYWGVKNTEDLDPVVKLILEALSSELYNLGNEIKDGQVRILEKVASLLAPDFLTAPNPAHALLHASPVEPQEVISAATSFFTQKKISSKQNEILDASLDIFVNAVDSVQIADAQISYLVTGGNLYSYNTTFNKQLIAKSKKLFTENSTAWIGLKVNAKLDQLQNFILCFDWKNLEPKIAHHKYQLLPLAKWYINDMQVKKSTGICYLRADDVETKDKNIFLEYDLLTWIEKDIKQYYQHKFITIDADNVQQSKLTWPPSFSGMFAETDLQKLTEKLLWLKVEFPAAIGEEYLDQVYIYPNTFPVMNRQMTDLKYRLKGGSNIIPLRTEMLNQFLCVKSLSDDTNQYKSVPYRKMEEEETGTYTLRSGGVERFDVRNARELISYLLELLRGESAAFSAYGYDFIAGTLKEMSQKISLMEQKTKGFINNATEIPNYIIVKPAEGHDMMYVAFWTTLAETANNLRAGTKLQQAKGVKIKPDSLMLMSTSTGGKNRLKPEERLNAFRYGIMTRNRIITKEDIRNFCFFELGEKLGKVEVEKGFELSSNSKQAFQRTIDVMLTPSEKNDLELKSWQILCEQLKSKLQNRSGLSNNYRVLVREEGAEMGNTK